MVIRKYLNIQRPAVSQKIYCPIMNMTIFHLEVSCHNIKGVHIVHIMILENIMSLLFTQKMYFI